MYVFRLKRAHIHMDIRIEENGCHDDEIKILDTKIPYVYEHVKKLFQIEPDSVQIVLVNSKETFSQLRGQQTNEGAFSKNHTIYIYEPRLFGVATTIHRKDFYRTLYQELVYLFYQQNKHS